MIAGGGRTVEVLDLEPGTSRVISTFAERGSFATLNLLGSGDLVVIGGYDDAINLRLDVRLLEAGDPSPNRVKHPA